MSRPLRIMYPNAFYHVMNRGSGRQCIFTHDDHFNIFLDLLVDVNARYQLEIHAYCLMNNHYHLLVCTPIPNLSEIMRFINGSFTQKINRLNRTDGPIFRGRYKAILVEKDNYLLELSRYIHLNPVSAKIVNYPEEYKWSSYKHYLNGDERPIWLHCDNVFAYFDNKIEKFRKFVMDGIDLSF